MTDSAKFLEPEPPGPFDPPNGAPYAAPSDPFPEGEALPPLNLVPQGATDPCADCQRNAAIAGYVGVVLGVAFGVTAAYLILKNRLAPRD
jgi:hypothetical protein